MKATTILYESKLQMVSFKKSHIALRILPSALRTPQFCILPTDEYHMTA